MKSPLRILTWLLGLAPLGLLPTTMTALAEGSKQLTPNTPAHAEFKRWEWPGSRPQP